MKAILDGDIIAYRAAFWADAEGADCLEDRLQDDLMRWTPPHCTIGAVALSCNRSDNFRKQYLPEYKEHRNARPKPDCMGYALDILKDISPVVMADNLEADDLMGIEKSAGRMVCVTIDKDLHQVPGLWWVPRLDDSDFSIDIQATTLEQADRWFYRQWLTGDSTDNVAGIWKLGPKKADRLLDSTSPVNWFALCLSQYEQKQNKNGTPYTLEDAIAMGVAVRILRDGEGVMGWIPHDWRDQATNARRIKEEPK